MESSIASRLKMIRQVPGVEVVVLVQQDGYPLGISGAWLSQEEVLGVCSSVAAIIKAVHQIHNKNPNYVVIEGDRAKLIISSLPQIEELRLAVLTHASVNMGAIFLKINEFVSIAYPELLRLRDLRVPPKGIDDAMLETLKRFSLRPGSLEVDTVEREVFEFSDDEIRTIRSLLDGLMKVIPQVMSAAFIIDGGTPVVTVSKTGSELEYLAPFLYSVMDVSKRLAWTLKRSQVTQFICDFEETNYILYDISVGILALKNSKEGLRLGLIKVFLPSYVKKLRDLIDNTRNRHRGYLSGILSKIMRIFRRG